MTTTEKYLLGTNATVVSTELNSLANNSLALSSSAFNNTAGGGAGDGSPMGELELVVGFSVSPNAYTVVSVWFIRTPDGSNYEDGASGTTPGKAPDVVFALRSATSQRIVQQCVLPPGNWKVLVKNESGQTLNSTGNTLKLRPFTRQAV